MICSSDKDCSRRLPTETLRRGSLNATAVLRSEKLGVATGGGFYPDVQLGLYSFTSGTGKATLTSDEDAGVLSAALAECNYTVAANGA